ncbi:MAG: M42 family metallopeptidase [Ruminococcus sp.]|nr:M42 family metallopeptidase [Ruminococcus sp.]
MKNLLKELCLVNGTSGDEAAVREAITEKIKDYCEYSVDALGNLICFCRGKKSSGKKVMVAAHMDEVGFIVTYIRDDGTLCFGEVGGVDASVAIGRQVTVGRNGISGVIGSTAVHNLSKEERETPPKFESLYIDIGAASREEAEQYVHLGDCVYFDSDFTELGGNCLKAKAIDDRAGCAVMIELIRQGVEYDTYFVFNVQEEIGLRGARVSAYSVAPDFAVVLEATTASDIDGVSGAKKVCSLGSGPVVGFMDRSTVYDKELYRLAFDTAAELGIPCQTKTMIAGGNDSGVIHLSRGGVRTIAISLPCRYIHSPSCTANSADLENMPLLAGELVKRVHEL